MVFAESPLPQFCWCSSHQAALSEFSLGLAHLAKRKPRGHERVCRNAMQTHHELALKSMSGLWQISAHTFPCKRPPVLRGETPLRLHIASALLLRGSLLFVSVPQSQVTCEFHCCRRAEGFLCSQAPEPEAAIARDIALCTVIPRLASIGSHVLLRLSLAASRVPPNLLQCSHPS